MKTEDLKKQFVKLLHQNAERFDVKKVFSDFCEIAAIDISFACDISQQEKRAKQREAAIKKYNMEERQVFCEMFGALVNWLEADVQNYGIRDNLGPLFMELGFGSVSKGQFLTPPELSQVMAEILLSDVAEKIQEKGFVRFLEPTVGAGGMLLAAAQVIRDKGFSVHAHSHFVGVDIDALAVHMAYIQMSLHAIPGVLIHGNTLSGEEWERWYTSFHVYGGWSFRLKNQKEACFQEVENSSSLDSFKVNFKQEEAAQLPESFEEILGQMSLF